MVNEIGFPGLSIGPFEISRVAFEIGPFTVHWYAIILIAAIIAGFVFALHEAKRMNIESDVIYDVVLWGLPSAVVGARLFYVIFSLDEMQGSILNIFKIWDGGLSIFGGLIGAVISTILYCRHKKIKVSLIFDICAIPLMIGQTIGRWGNFVNAEVYGQATNVLWRMSINGVEVHPLFLYESLLMLLGIAVLIFYKSKKRFDGEIFLIYIAWYGIVRGFLEGMRQDEFILRMFGLPISQIVAFVSAAVAIGLLIYCYLNQQKLNLTATKVYNKEAPSDDTEVVKVVPVEEAQLDETEEEQEKKEQVSEASHSEEGFSEGEEDISQETDN